MYYLAEYATYIGFAAVLGAVLFAASAMFVIGQEGARHLPAARKVAERTIHVVEASAKSASSLISPVSSTVKRV